MCIVAQAAVYWTVGGGRSSVNVIDNLNMNVFGCVRRRSPRNLNYRRLDTILRYIFILFILYNIIIFTFEYCMRLSRMVGREKYYRHNNYKERKSTKAQLTKLHHIVRRHTNPRFSTYIGLRLITDLAKSIL